MRVSTAVLLAASALALTGCTKPWKVYQYPAWNFGVSFRQPPTVTNTPADPKTGAPASFKVETIQGGRDLAVEVDDTSVSGKSDEDLLREIPHDAVSDSGGTVAAHSTVTVGKATGPDITIDRGGQGTKRIRVFVINHKAYQLITQSPNSGEDKEVQQFLDSFHFLS
jgi:hypothetical protein